MGLSKIKYLHGYHYVQFRVHQMSQLAKLTFKLHSYYLHKFHCKSMKNPPDSGEQSFLSSFSEEK